MKRVIDRVIITGTGKEKPILQFQDLPKKYQKRMYKIYYHNFMNVIKTMEYLEYCSFFIYRKNVYNLSDMMKTPDSSTIKEFSDAYENETYFSGILVKLVDTNFVKCYSYYS